MNNAPTRKNKYIISTLIAIAKADGEIHEKEKQILYKIAQSNDISPEELEEEIQANHVILPEYLSLSDMQKTKHLIDFFRIAIADGDMSESEIKVLYRMTASLGYSKEEVKELIDIAKKELDKISNKKS